MTRLRTLTSTGLLPVTSDRTGPKARSPLLSALTAEPRPYERTLFFVPYGREMVQRIQMAPFSMDEAKTEWYKCIWGTVGAAIVAILNTEAIRRIGKTTALIERSCETGHFRTYSDVQTAVQTARAIREEANSLVTPLSETPEDARLAARLANLCTRFHQQVINPVQRYDVVPPTELMEAFPEYSFYFDNRQGSGGREFKEISGAGKVLDLIEEGHSPILCSAIEGFRLNGRAADVFFYLRFAAREGSFLSSALPSDLPSFMDPIGLYIGGEPATRFADFLQALEANLRNLFEVVDSADGKTLTVYKK